MAGRDIKTIVPNGEHVTVSAAGTFVFVKETTGELGIELTGEQLGKLVIMDAGDKITERGKGFDSFIAHNDTGADVTVIFTVGYGDFDKAALVGTVSVSQPSNVTDQPDVACAAGARTLVSAAGATKRETMIRHLNNNPGILRVGGATVAVAQGMHVTSNEQATINGSGAVYVWNTTAASITVTVTEIHD